MSGTFGAELLAEALRDYPNQIWILLISFSDVDVLKDTINREPIFRYLENL